MNILNLGYNKNMKNITFQHGLRFLVSFGIVLVLRLIPWKMPNLEGVMATLMPVSKRYGGFAGFIYGALSIVLFDAITGRVGLWTLITALSYGAIGAWASYAFAKKRPTTGDFVKFSIVATLSYDFVTGVLMGPALFGMSFTAAFIGQIPFTGYHLLGNILLSALVAPALLKWFEMETVGVLGATRENRVNGTRGFGEVN